VNKRFKYEDYEVIWKSSQAQGNDLLLLLALVKFRQPAGMYATKETLATLMRCNVDTVDRTLKRLKALGELIWDKGSSHSKRANRYFILLPGLDLDPNNTPLISPRNSPRNSRETPPDSQGENPPKLTPLNSNETEIKVKQEITVFDARRFGDLHLVSIEVSGLSPLKVLELLEAFARSYESSSAYTEKVRLDRWWQYLAKFSVSQTEGMN
jgi:Helix-turn-helix domain